MKRTEEEYSNNIESTSLKTPESGGVPLVDGVPSGHDETKRGT